MADPPIRNRNVGFGFPLSFSNGRLRSTGGVSSATPTADQLRESFLLDAVHLLATGKGERVMHPHFGVDTRVYLFDPLNSRQPALLGIEIAQQFALWVRRLRLTSYSAVLDPQRAAIRIEARLESLEYPVEAGLDVAI